MFTIFGLLGAAIGLMLSAVLAELVGGLLGVALAIGTGILSIFAGVVSWLCPNFTLRDFPIKHPASEYKSANETISFSPFRGIENSNGILDFFLELCFLPMVISGHRDAQKQIKILAEMDYPHCAALLGKIYKEGGGRKHNEKAVYWLQKAIDKNDPGYDVHSAASKLCFRDAYLDLAELYLYGKGVHQDFERCLSLLDKSAFGSTEDAKDLRTLANWKLKQLKS